VMRHRTQILPFLTSSLQTLYPSVTSFCTSLTLTPSLHCISTLQVIKNFKEDPAVKVRHLSYYNCSPTPSVYLSFCLSLPRSLSLHHSNPLPLRLSLCFFLPPCFSLLASLYGSPSSVKIFAITNIPSLFAMAIYRHLIHG
jgi:hypothetical protein